jgi:uncharacterized damage-inducible protein DinB
MAPDPTTIFLDYSARKLEQFTTRIRDSVLRLSQDQIWMRGHESENAVGNLILHLEGNVRQWILHGVGGRPDVRVRDREFAARGDIPASEILERLEATVAEAVAVIRAVTQEQVVDMVEIQKYELPVLEAIYHVVEHFAQHTGQIIFATKMLTGKDLGYYKHLTEPVAPISQIP